MTELPEREPENYGLTVRVQFFFAAEFRLGEGGAEEKTEGAARRIFGKRSVAATAVPSFI